MCRRFDTIPACDRQTDRQRDGIAIASKALAMRALRRAVIRVWSGLVSFNQVIFGSFTFNLGDKCDILSSKK